MSGGEFHCTGVYRDLFYYSLFHTLIALETPTAKTVYPFGAFLKPKTSFNKAERVGIRILGHRGTNELWKVMEYQ